MKAAAAAWSSYAHHFRSLSRNARFYLLQVLLSGLAANVRELFFNLYVDARGTSRQALGTLNAIPSLLSLVFALPAGLLADRIGRKPALLLSRIGSTAALAGFVLAPSLPWMFLFQFLAGAFDVLWVVTAAAFMVENSAPAERNALFSAHYGLSTLVGLIGYLGGGYLPELLTRVLGLTSTATAYQATLGVVALISLASVLPLLALKSPSAQPGARRVKPAELWRFFSARSRFLGPFLITALISYLGAALVIPYFNLFMRYRFSLDDEALGRVFAVAQGVTGFMILLAPLLADRWGRIRSMVWTGLASILPLLAIGFVPLPGVALVSFWLRAGLIRIGNPLYDAFYLEHFEAEERATASSLQQMAFYVGWSGGHLFSGQIRGRWGDASYPALFVLTAAFYALFLVLVYVLFAREDRPETHPLASLHF